MQSKSTYLIASIATQGSYPFRWIDATKAELNAVRGLIRDGVVSMERTDRADTVTLSLKRVGQ